MPNRDPSLNDVQRQELGRYFQKWRSSLREYAQLGAGQRNEINMQPSNVSAVRPSNKAQTPFIIEVVPPDVFPDPDNVYAPVEFNLEDHTTRLGGYRALTQDEDADSVFDSGGNIEQEPRDFLDNMGVRQRLFNDSTRRLERDLDRINRPMVGHREEVRDTVMEESREVQESRNPGDPVRLLRRQIQHMRQLEPLVMYVNPAEFSVSYQHVISDGNRTRNGFTIEHWGLEQPTISASGSIGATYISKDLANGKKGGGVTRTLRRGSAAFQEFMSLFNAYKNNAYIFNMDRRISMVGAVKIYYDDFIYTGSFDSFSISEAEDQPYTLEYSFDFVVRFEHRIDPHESDDMTFAPSEVDPDQQLFQPDEVDFDIGGEDDDEMTFTPEEVEQAMEEQQRLDDILAEFDESEIAGDLAGGLAELTEGLSDEEIQEVNEQVAQQMFGKSLDALSDAEREAMGID